MVQTVCTIAGNKPGGLVADYMGLARDLVAHVRNNVTNDWSLPEHMRVQLRVLAKHVLRKNSDPPANRKSKARPTASRTARLIRSAAWLPMKADVALSTGDRPPTLKIGIGNSASFLYLLRHAVCRKTTQAPTSSAV